MRLLTFDTNDKLRLTGILADGDIPPYAIFSHTWGNDGEEVLFRELESGSSTTKAGYRKIELCGQQARRDDWQYFWVDTCCINKADSTELSKAITYMYRWYQKAQVCYVYLADVSSNDSTNEAAAHENLADPPWAPSFRKSRWFTRGWTLQELLAPNEVVFYSKEWKRLGTKDDLKDLIHRITGIPIDALGGQPLSQFSVAERMRWSLSRRTTEKEDQAYCLLGIFNVYMPLIYGEGDNAYRRLRTEIDNKFSKNAPQYPLSSPKEIEPLGLCMGSAPLLPPTEFVGRTVEIDDIYNILRPDEFPSEQRRAVLGGIGGVGKTQLAIAYARQHKGYYSSVFWLQAQSELTLFHSLRSFPQLWGSTSLFDELDTEQAFSQFRRWLAHSNNHDWLLIFDNYENPDEYDISKFLPNTGHGSIIITTRLPSIVAGTQVQVRPLKSTEESLRILQLRSARETAASDADARRLAERLSGLPLALATAGAYLRKSTMTFQQYLVAYEERWRVDPHRSAQLLDYPDRTLYTTWNLSYARLMTDHSEAAQILKLLAYFDYQEIWYDLFQAGLSSSSPTWLPTCLTSETSFESVMDTLVDYSLLELQHETRSYSINRCVHDWTLGALNTEIDIRQYIYAFDCVSYSITDIETDALSQIQYAQLGRHGLRLANGRFMAEEDIKCHHLECYEQVETIATLLQARVESTADLLTSHAFFEAAEQMYIRVLAGKDVVLESEDPSTLWTFVHFGALYYQQGKLEVAEQMYRRALAGFENILGSEHPTTLQLAIRLAFIYSKQGKVVQAEQMFLEAIAESERVLGLDHATISSAACIMGNFYVRQGKLIEAEQMFVRSLTGYDKSYGPENLNSIEVAHNVANIFYCRGKFVEAEQMYIRALAGKEQQLGLEHTSTLDTLQSFGSFYVDQGRGVEAELLVFRALIGRQIACGLEHETTLKSLDCLAALYSGQGRMAEVQELLYQADNAKRQALGLNRLDTNAAYDLVQKLNQAIMAYQNEMQQIHRGRSKKRDRLKSLLRFRGL